MHAWEETSEKHQMQSIVMPASVLALFKSPFFLTAPALSSPPTHTFPAMSAPMLHKCTDATLSAFKTTVHFSIADRVGALDECLAAIKALNISLTRIES